MRITLIVSAFLSLLLTPIYADEKVSSKKELSDKDFKTICNVLSIIAHSGYIIKSGIDFYHFIYKTPKPKSEDEMLEELLHGYKVLTMQEIPPKC